MVLKRTIFLMCLTMATPGVAAAQGAASPAAQPSPQPMREKSKTPKAKAPALITSRCASGQLKNGSACSNAAPALSKINSGRSQVSANTTTPKLIFNDAPKNFLPFQNDLATPKNTPVGGLVGLEFPF